MNDITVQNRQLPETIEELAQYSLIGRDALASVRAKINAMEKAGMAKAVIELTRSEAQDMADNVTMAEVRLGEILKAIPKATTNHKSQILEIGRRDDFLKPKSEVIKAIGISQTTAERFQKMADHEDVVREAMAEARENDDIISRSQVLRKIAEAEHKPHVSHNSGNNEWYTPIEIIETARLTMGSIDLDPASSDIANETVQAKAYYTAEDNGIEQEWYGNVWLNPPYSTDLIGAFADKLADEIWNIDQAIVLVNNATETEWFGTLVDLSDAICFPRTRIKYNAPDGKKNSPLQGQAILYYGEQKEEFVEKFSVFGWCAYPV